MVDAVCDLEKCCWWLWRGVGLCVGAVTGGVVVGFVGWLVARVAGGSDVCVVVIGVLFGGIELPSFGLYGCVDNEVVGEFGELVEGEGFDDE